MHTHTHTYEEKVVHTIPCETISMFDSIISACFLFCFSLNASVKQVRTVHHCHRNSRKKDSSFSAATKIAVL